LSLPDGLFAPHEIVRRLGTRPNPLYVLRQAGVGIGGKPVLAVAERYAGAAQAGPDGEDLAHDARRIATLASPNLARVREVLVRGDDLVVIGEFVEGEKLQELWRPDKLPLEIALRVIVDALAGVGALHNLRDAKQQPMKLAHGEVSPATIVLGLDGIARVLHSVSRRVPGVEPEPASRGYLSPEVASGDPYDARADVFSAGVLLWEALSEKPLFTEPDPAANALRVRSGPLPPAKVPEKAAWAKGLVEVAAKALCAEPDARWPTAAVMAAELRKAAGLKLAPASTAAAFARSGFGERVRTRRESLDVSSPPSPAARADPIAVAPPPPPKPPPRPPESSFLEVDLESALDTVLVAPGIRASVAEVIELGPESLLDAVSDSSAPPAASSAPGGFVVDPFRPSSAVPQAPAVARFGPPLSLDAGVRTVQSHAAIEEPPPPSITGAPYFAAAIDRPPPGPPTAVAPYVAVPFQAPPLLETPAEEEGARVAAARRRRVLVLGGVAAFGVVVLLLAVVRLARREPDVAPAATHPITTTVVAVAPPPPAISAAVPPASAPPPSTSAASTAVATPPLAQPTTPHATPPAIKPPPQAAAATALPVPVAHGPTGPKPRPKPTFDPNSL
jgi:serine/threonine-protein kinase